MAQTISETTIMSLIDAAYKAAENSYSPYSHFRVGAALLCSDNSIITGTNVENRSYGATICAEQSALTHAVSIGKRNFTAIAVIGLDSKDILSPCGICRQILSEFEESMMVIMADKAKKYIISSLKELNPHSTLDTFQKKHKI